GRMLTPADLTPDGSPNILFAWDPSAGQPLAYDPARRSYERNDVAASLSGTYTVRTLEGNVEVQPAFQLCVEAARPYTPDAVEAITGVPHHDVEQAARLLWEARPAAYYAWSGVEQQTNATQIYRAISFVYALTGCWDARGGNVLFPSVPAHNVAGLDLSSAEQRSRALGLPRRPLGPSQAGWVTTDEVYSAILDDDPYPVRALVGFG